MIEVYDNLLHEVERDKIYQEIVSLPYRVMEWDQEPEEVSGNRSDLPETSFALMTLRNCIERNIKHVEGLTLSQAYVNHFSPREIPYFHIDSSDEKSITVLYYADVWDKYDINEGGGTEFLIKDNLMTVLPETGRIVCFSSNLVHRATTYRDNHRFTIAFKYINT
jgi:hypothetical protein